FLLLEPERRAISLSAIITPSELMILSIMSSFSKNCVSQESIGERRSVNLPSSYQRFIICFQRCHLSIVLVTRTSRGCECYQKRSWIASCILFSSLWSRSCRCWLQEAEPLLGRA